MNKKLAFIFLVVTFLVSFVFPNINANELEIGDFYAKNEAYSFSEDSDEIYMPFMRFCSESIKVDKKINNIGAIFSSKIIEVNEEINAPVAIFAQDTVRVNEKISDATIFSTANVIIEKGSKGTMIVFSTGDITLSEDAVVEGDLICFSTNLYIKGKVNGNVIGATDNIELTGTIAKDLRMEVKDIAIENDKNVSGNVYLETMGENSKVQALKSLYPNLINKIISINETKTVDVTTKIISIIVSIATTVVISWILYLLISKFSKTKIFESNLAKVVKYKTPIILIGSLSIVAIPIVLVIVILLLVFGAYIIAVPIITIYTAIIILGISVNVFVIGSLAATLILKKSDIKQKPYLKVMVPFVSFLVVSLIPHLPYISGIAGILYVMATIGIITVCMFKKSERTEENN